MSQIIKYIWLTTLSASIISQLLEGVFIIDVACALACLILAIFYFYGSAFYFLNLKFQSFKHDLGKYDTFTKVFGTIVGLPFAITSISIVFLIFRFPAAQLIFFIAVFIFIICFIISRYKFSKEPQKESWKFIQRELNWLALYNILVIVLIVLTWSDNPLNLNWSDIPSDAPRY